MLPRYIASRYTLLCVLQRGSQLWMPRLSMHRVIDPKGDCLIFYKDTDMPKMKTNSSAKKRFKLTGSGKIKRKHAFKSHILTKKSTKQKRNLTYFTTVHKADENNIKILLAMR